MENLNAEAVYIIFNEINHRLTEQYERTTIAWHRYKECGANKELYQKIYDLLTILKEQGNQIAEDISKEIITIFSFYFDPDDPDENGNVIPFTTEIDLSINKLKSECARIIFPLKESSNETIRNLVLSIENELIHIRKDCKKYIFDEPFSTSINLDDYHDICCDPPFVAWNEHRIDWYTAYYFMHVFISNEEICTKLVNKALEELIHYFKPFDCATAMDVYHLAQKLPLNFVRAYFHFYEQDTLRYSQLISSLLYDDAREFVKLFHETIFKQIKEHYYFLRLAFDYFELFSKRSGMIPRIKHYLSKDQGHPVHICKEIGEHMVWYLGDYIEMTKQFKEQIPEIPRYISVEATDTSANSIELISQIEEQTSKAGINPLLLNNKESVCYISHGEINKKYDLKKLVRHLTSINESIDKILVETINSENKVEDCLTYFFYPFDESIRSKIREKSFNPDFRLEWGGRHLSSLKALIRLLTNTKEDATVDNVFDRSEGDRLSRDHVSLRDDKSPIWKPVEKVFGKTVYNANINKKASPDTISKNESEIQAIIKIVFACKK